MRSGASLNTAYATRWIYSPKERKTKLALEFQNYSRSESDQDIINSMETLRQFFKAGLVDSCFWHKFVLTRHSRLYDEWSKGEHRDLKVIEPENTGLFAKNGLHFEGEEKSRKFGHGLETSLLFPSCP